MPADINKGDILKTSPEIIGPVEIGQVNPRGISREDFLNAPGLLYNGAGMAFEFDQNFDYSRQPVNSTNSHTIGKGFYATPKRLDAALFSKAFGAKEEPIVMEVLPYKARMFDFRTKDVSRNAPVPAEMLANYVQFVQADFDNNWNGYNPEEDIDFLRTYPPDDVPNEVRRSNPVTFEDYFVTIPGPNTEERGLRSNRWSNYNDAQNYLRILQSKYVANKNVDLREMLSLLGDATASEYASHHFHDFMLSQGFDGAIYIEGGDHLEQIKPVSFVFFNLDKLGTYETWNPDGDNK